MTHQASWLESTGACGVQQKQAGGSFNKLLVNELRLSADGSMLNGQDSWPWQLPSSSMRVTFEVALCKLCLLTHYAALCIDVACIQHT